MAIPKSLKKRMLNIIASAEKKQQKNNCFVINEDEKIPDIPEKSLLIILTPYES